jgi:hypothetical protein
LEMETLVLSHDNYGIFTGKNVKLDGTERLLDRSYSRQSHSQNDVSETLRNKKSLNTVIRWESLSSNG